MSTSVVVARGSVAQPTMRLAKQGSSPVEQSPGEGAVGEDEPHPGPQPLADRGRADPGRRFRGAEGERPPLLVVIHGGPTSKAAPVLDVAVQYWTSRAVVRWISEPHAWIPPVGVKQARKR